MSLVICTIKSVEVEPKRAGDRAHGCRPTYFPHGELQPQAQSDADARTRLAAV